MITAQEIAAESHLTSEDKDYYVAAFAELRERYPKIFQILYRDLYLKVPGESREEKAVLATLFVLNLLRKKGKIKEIENEDEIFWKDWEEWGKNEPFLSTLLEVFTEGIEEEIKERIRQLMLAVYL